MSCSQFIVPLEIATWRNARTWFVVVVLLLASLVAVMSLSPAYCKPAKVTKSPEWLGVAKATVVARARLDIPAKTILQLKARSTSDYVDLPIQLLEVVKGPKLDARLLVKYYAENAGLREPDLACILSLNHRDVMVLLIQVDECRPPQHFFCDDSKIALRPFKERDWLRLKQEYRRQQKIIAQFSTSRLSKKDSTDARVKVLIDQFAELGMQRSDSWQKLLDLPSSYIPALVRAMDDFRMLKDSNVTLLNPPGAFEAIAHYGPKTVLDAVSILLHEHTGVSMGFIHNGGSNRERKANLDAWRIWLSKTH